MNRHLYGDMMPISVTVPDCVLVKPGDLMIIARLGRHDIGFALKGKSGGTNYAYPFASAATSTVACSGTTRLNYSFCGVALDNSPHGSTDTISCATAGVFEFPLLATAGVTAGVLAKAQPTGQSAASHTSASYTVFQLADGGVSIGWFCDTKASAERAGVAICTKFGRGPIVLGGAA